MTVRTALMFMMTFVIAPIEKKYAGKHEDRCSAPDDFGTGDVWRKELMTTEKERRII